MSDRQQRILAGVLSAVVVTAAVQYLTRSPGSFITNLVQSYEYRSYDSRMKSRAGFSEEGSIDDVILIDIDLNSVQEMGNYYDWPHSYHGQLIDVVSSGNPHAIIFDIIFDPKSSYNYDLVNALLTADASTDVDVKEAADQFLISNDPNRLIESTAASPFAYHTIVLEHPDTNNFLYAMDALPGSYLAQGHTISIPDDASKRLPSADRIGNLHFDLLNASQGVGTPNFPPDKDGIIRRAPTAIRFNGTGQVFPSITLAASMDILGIPEDGVHYDFDNNILELSDSTGSLLRSIPIDDQGRIFVNYYGPFKTFNYIPYLYCFDPEMLDPSYWEGKVAIVGSALAGLGDLKSTSVQESFAGPEIHANVIHSILKNEFLRPVTGSEHFWVILVVTVLVGILCGIPEKPFYGFLILGIGSVGWVVFATNAFLSSSVMWDVVRPITAMALTQLSVFSYTFVVMDKDKRFLKNTFSAYISPKLIDQMVENKEEPKLGGRESVHTAFFTDIESFSAFSEQLSATDLVELLNSYLTNMTTILLEHKGTLDKYIGDAIVAFYGAPMPVENHELWACKTALKMQDDLSQLRLRWQSEGDKWPAIVHNMQNRIGIHTGPMVTGNMGSTQRMNYTMMGDTVNLAARLESACKQYGIYTHISEDTYKNISNDVTVRELDRIQVIGRENPVTTYELISLKGEESAQHKELIDGFADGLSKYKNQDWGRARAVFENTEKLEDMFKGRKTNPSRVYVERCNMYKESPPAKNWDGVTRLTKK